MAKSNAGNAATGCGCLVLLGILLGLGITISSCGHSSDTTATNTAPVADPDIQIGDEGQLDNSADTVLVAHTLDASKRLTDAEIAKDTVGMQQIIDAGDAFMVPKGTKVKLIGYGDGIMAAATYHVRFEGGSHADDDGWVPREWMKK